MQTLSCIPGKWSHETGVHIERPAHAGARAQERRLWQSLHTQTHTHTYGVAIYFLTADAEWSLDARKIPVDKNHSMCRAGHAADQSLDRVYIRPRAASPRTAADSKKKERTRAPLYVVLRRTPALTSWHNRPDDQFWRVARCLLRTSFCDASLRARISSTGTIPTRYPCVLREADPAHTE